MRTIFVAVIVGLLFFGLQAKTSVAANLVQNGGFETGDFTGWTLSGNIDGYSSVGMWPHHSGNYALGLGSQGSDFNVSQSIPTITGQTYLISYWLAVDGGVPPHHFSHFAASLGGTSLFDQTEMPVQDYTYYKFPVVASSSNAILTFSSRYDDSFLYLDDVSVKAAPIPAAAWLLATGLLTLVGIRKKLNI